MKTPKKAKNEFDSKVKRSFREVHYGLSACLSVLRSPAHKEMHLSSFNTPISNMRRTKIWLSAQRPKPEWKSRETRANERRRRKKKHVIHRRHGSLIAWLTWEPHGRTERPHTQRRLISGNSFIASTHGDRVQRKHREVTWRSRGGLEDVTGRAPQGKKPKEENEQRTPFKWKAKQVSREMKRWRRDLFIWFPEAKAAYQSLLRNPVPQCWGALPSVPNTERYSTVCLYPVRHPTLVSCVERGWMHGFNWDASATTPFLSAERILTELKIHSPVKRGPTMTY